MKCIRKRLGAGLIFFAIPTAYAADLAKFETIPLGTTQEDTRHLLGEPDAMAEHTYPFGTTEFIYRFPALSGKDDNAHLLFDNYDKLVRITFIPLLKGKTFDPTKLDKLPLGTSLAEVRHNLGEPDTFIRENHDIQLIYIYPESKRQAQFFFYDGELSQIFYSPSNQATSVTFDMRKLAAIGLGEAEGDFDKLLGTPEEASRSNTFDTKTYRYSGPEKRKLEATFWPPGKLTNLDIIFDGPANFHPVQDESKFDELQWGMPENEVRARLGDPDEETRSVNERSISYYFQIPKTEARLLHFVYSADGRLGEFTISKADIKPAVRPAEGEIGFLKLGMSRSRINALLGNADDLSYPVVRTENHMFTAKFDAEGSLARTSNVVMPANEGLVNDGLVARVHLRPAQGTPLLDIRQSLGDPDIERHKSDGTIEFEYDYKLARGPDGQGGGELTALYSFTPAGKFTALTYTGDGVQKLELPSHWP